MNEHTRTLKYWWDEAEQGEAKPGDQIIERHVNEETSEVIRYVVGTHREGMRGLIGKSGTRILSRAPEPNPEWHDADAVMARCEGASSTHREVFLRSDATEDVWIGEAGWANTHNLVDVTPMIEKKVTDQMVEEAAIEWRAQSTLGHLGDRIERWMDTDAVTRDVYRRLARVVLEAAIC